MKKIILISLLSFSTIVNAKIYTVEDGIKALENDNSIEAINIFNTIESGESKYNKYDLYYNRGLAYSYIEDFENGKNNLSLAIEIEPNNPKAYLLRGQIYFALNNNNLACQDIKKAASLGDISAETLSQKYCSNDRKVIESYVLDWPDEEGWEIASQQDDQFMSMTELIRNGETLDNWTEIGTGTAYHGLAQVISLNKFIEIAYAETKKSSPNVKQTIIEKDFTSEYPWVIYKMEYAGYSKVSEDYFKKNNTEYAGSKSLPEAQVFFIIKGEKTIFSVSRAIHEDTIPKEIQDKWVKFFKSGHMVQNK